MTDKEVMQMALDWFHWFQHGTNPNGAHVLEVEEALRTALAQPEPAECDGGQCGIGGYCKQCPKTQHEPEPVAWGGVTIWLGDLKFTQFVSDLQIKCESYEGTSICDAAQKCLDMLADELKEKNK